MFFLMLALAFLCMAVCVLALKYLLGVLEVDPPLIKILLMIFALILLIVIIGWFGHHWPQPPPMWW